MICYSKLCQSLGSASSKRTRRSGLLAFYLSMLALPTFSGVPLLSISENTLVDYDWTQTLCSFRISQPQYM